MSAPRRNIMWFRRDLRIGDNPALLAAIESSDEVIPLFILDKSQITEAGAKLLAYMGQSLRALDQSLGNKLHIIEGDQVEILRELIELYGVKGFPTIMKGDNVFDGPRTAQAILDFTF